MWEWLGGYLKDMLNEWFLTFVDWANKTISDAWPRLKEVLIGSVLVPLGYYVFRPMFRLTAWGMEIVLNKVYESGNVQALEFAGLSAWLMGCFRIQEILTVVLSFIVIGLIVKVILKVLRLA